uniref:Uncharacterized protein n=1 Tax=Siphoviridae sp. ct3R43 TaxID=2825321 RepID=A0A8S5VFX3_9CAUD|nr:MAG TPA: hypothetical protein [Siphoviridae sp. ct3R43]
MHTVRYSFSNLLTRPPPHYGSALCGALSIGCRALTRRLLCGTTIISRCH